MSFEDPLHDQLAEEMAASRRPPLGDLVGRSVTEGRRKHRRRTATGAGLGIVGVLGVAAAVQFAPSVHGTAKQNVGAGVGTPLATPAPFVGPATSAAPTAPATPAPTKPQVRVVAPGKLDVGDGMSLTLTHDSVVVSDGSGGQVGPLYTDNGNQALSSVGLQAAGRLVSGLYIGPGDVASAILTSDGKSYDGTVVTLAGHPGWCDVYVVLPRNPDFPNLKTAHWTVYDAHGHVLAGSDTGI